MHARTPALLLIAAVLVACRTTANEPVLFASGPVTTAADEFATTFTPDGRTVFFNRVEGDHYLIFSAQLTDGGWSAAQRAPFSNGSARDIDPFVTPDGRILVFTSNRPRPGTTSDDFNLWAVRATSAGWSAPELLPSPPNSADNEVFATLSANETIYFSRRMANEPRRIFRSERLAGGWKQPVQVVLDVAPEASLGNPLIGPDESFLVFTSRDLGGAGSVDLFLTRRSSDGSWSVPIALPVPINSAAADYAPGIGADGTTLYFSSRRARDGTSEESDERPPGDLYAVSLEPFL